MAEEICSINCLPNEIISLILQKNNSKEILRFGATCRRFNDFVKSNQYLWKDITKRSLPEQLYNILEEHCDGNWLNELKGFNTVQKQVYFNLCAMSPQFYGQDSDVSIQDVRPFFKVALQSRFSYNYSIYILQEVIRKGNIIVDEGKKVRKPYTLTEMHYARIVLRHLIHTFLSLKWVRAHMGNELPPETVCNFFIQWIDTIAMHPDEDVDSKISDLVTRVKLILEEKRGTKASEDVPREKIVVDREVLGAVTQVVYRQRHMAVTTAANLDTLDIVRVLNTKVGNVIVVTAIYQAVAKKCGVNCELIAFPNHLFLEWRDNSDPKNPQVYTVDPTSGELNRRRRCPFSQNGPATNYRYCPDSLLQYICSSFHMSMGAIRNCNTYNALHLLDFLGTNLNTPTSYRNFLPYLLDQTHLSAMNSPLNLEHFSVKKHGGNVKYAVGMTCYHNKYDYVCIIRGWDAQCALKWQCQMAAESLYFGVTQPFYNVIAADQSERYVPQDVVDYLRRKSGYTLRVQLQSRHYVHFNSFVVRVPRVLMETVASAAFWPKDVVFRRFRGTMPQLNETSGAVAQRENLQDLARPTRMYHLEDVIATEFTHFDGFAYVPNDEKRAEFPEDEAIVNVYRERHQLLSETDE